MNDAQNYDGKDNNSEFLKNNKNCNFDNKIKIKDCSKGSISCFLSNIKNEEFYKAPDLFKYYISLEKMLRSSSVRSKTDRISKYFTFYPVSMDKEYYEEKINNHVFLEAVRNILFDLDEGNKKDKKKVFSSFVIVVDTLISLIKKEKVVKEMYMFIHLFFQDLNLLNKKILDILLKSSFKPGASFNIPDFNKKNFEFILSRIYTRYVLNNLLNKTFNNSDTINMSDFLNNKIKPFNFSFTETSVNLLKNEGIQIKDDDLLVSEENLCKYIPIKKKYNSRRGTVYHFIKKKENIIMNKSGKQRNVNLIEQKRFKKNTLIDIKKNIMNLKKIVKSTIHMERKEKIKPHKFYSYDELMKLTNT
ncbi:hypothetical protein PFFVO_00659 [Plasmodium falciparum Vietnam Oak-Knoll (FVO)]|uniref:Uncharacterized protein n=1 Tax=Plasmodium falciparum Vietnam Oak-Knoll (FVO) TaxID=1036723 RepID=A0A024VC79_PLAFA|nr:hypothetical protein PFFVO_00659 [Plasmodium falciparum Vietnam Oak-Knoll (FVO)]